MSKYLNIHQNVKYSLKFMFISLSVLLIIIPLISLNKNINFMITKTHNPSNTIGNTDDLSFKTSKINNLDEDPEEYFPDFLYYSVITADAMIEYLFDNEEGGFYKSADEHWSESSINPEKRTYDQAQAILALLKLSEAVINETQREISLNVAEATGNYLVSHLYDEEFDGFFSSTLDRYKRPGIEGKAIQALNELFEATGNITYQEKAEDTLKFINTFGWDVSGGGYYSKLSHSGVVAAPSLTELYKPDSKRADHNAMMGSALLDLYNLTSDNSHLSKAITIYDLFNSSCRNNDTGFYYGGIGSDGTIVDSESADLFINALMLEFLTKLYATTDDQKYFDEISNLVKAILYGFWDDTYGGFFATYSYNDQEDPDIKKYTERQFYAINALDKAYKLTNNNLYYNLIFDMMEFLNTHLYDEVHDGYFQLTNENGDPGNPDWKYKYSVTQALAISELTDLWMHSKPGVLNALWLPSLPRPQDPVTIIVAAFDSDGIADVLCNYSIDDKPYFIVEMQADSRLGNMYNTSFDHQPVGTTMNFNIIVNDTLGNEVIRGSYFFVWQYDIWSPHVELLGLDPGEEVPVYSIVTMTVSAHDVPTQGYVTNIRIYYHLEGKSEDSKQLIRVDAHIWRIEFTNGFNVPGTYAFYFEAIDDRGNFGYTSVGYIYVMGQLETIPVTLIFGALLILVFATPASIAGYKEYQKRSAKRAFNKIKNSKGMKRRRTRRTRRMRN